VIALLKKSQSSSRIIDTKRVIDYVQITTARVIQWKEKNWVAQKASVPEK
jgi:hypothetical protein